MATEPVLRPETTRLIFNLTKDAPAHQLADVDAADAKGMSIFAAASTVMGLAAFAFADGGGSGVTVLLIAAIVAYLSAVGAVFIAVRPRNYQYGDYVSLWRNHWDQPVAEIEHALAESIPNVVAHNAPLLRAKAVSILIAIGALGAETTLISVALVASRF